MFFGTGLDELLRTLDVDQVILAGVNTHACVRTAAIDAYQRDLPVFILRECVASKDMHHHDVSMNYMDGGIAALTTLPELRRRLAMDPSLRR
jgi:maleamate amidohydrolase